MAAFMLMALVVSVVVCYGVARKRGADPKFWVIMSVLFGPFAIPFVFFAKRRRSMGS